MNLEDHPHIKDLLAMLLTSVIGAMLIFGCNSCSTSKTVEKSYTEISQDSTVHHSKDSVYISKSDNSTDSIVKNTIVYVTLDSLGNETKRVEYHDTYHSRVRDIDNNKVSAKTDTLYKTQYKMVEKILYKTVIKEAAFSLFQKAMMTAGKLALLAVAVWLLVFLFKHRGTLQKLIS